MKNEELLLDSAKRLKIELDRSKASKMMDFGEALMNKSKYLNLLGPVGENEFVIKHLCDSLTIASRPELTGSIADIGTGGGLPGVIIKIFRPELDVSLVDSTIKKLNAVSEICAGLGIEIKTLHCRAEEMGTGEYRDYFDAVTARAVAPLSRLLEYCLPLVKPGGCFLAMKGPGAEREIKEALRAEKLLFGKMIKAIALNLPDGAKRVIVIYRKTGATPAGFPRASGVILRKPL